MRLYWPVELRPAFDALFEIEDALLDVVGTSTQPALGAVRLAWWRDALERLDHAPPPPEPRLQACAQQLLSNGVSGKQLSSIAEGYATLFEEAPDMAAIESAGAAMFHCAATLLAATDPRLEQAGGRYALARVHRLGLMAARAEPSARLTGHRFAKPLRPLTALARLSERDLRRGEELEPEATPARAAALLAHRLTGTIA
ncbi:MAG TPA: hypothetical protein VFO42_01805 [Sphingomicrobium sp.]|nr:hypothetical protein [Sphingomicrobium sp.]